MAKDIRFCPINLSPQQGFNFCKSYPMVRNNESFEYLFAVQTKIKNNYKEQLHISPLAQDAGVSESKLQHDYRLAFGVSMQEFHTELRMTEAKEMLLNSKLSVKKIGLLVGYKNVSNFTNAFTKYYGKAPSLYRNR